MRGVCFSVVVVVTLTAANSAVAKDFSSCTQRDARVAPSENYGPNWNGAWLPVEIARQRLGLNWPQKPGAAPDVFPADAMIKAVKALGEVPPPAVTLIPGEGYAVPAASAAATAAYDEAARLYRLGEFDKAMLAFDFIALDLKSPYRAAAAYTAARASLVLGRYADGIRRLDRLLDDPSLAEFHSAALKLLGTLQYQYGNAAYLAAHLTQIVHVLSAPPSVICRYAALAPLRMQAFEDFRWLIQMKSDDPRAAATGTPISQVVHAIGPNLPLLDLYALLNAPTPFAEDFGWLDDFSYVIAPGTRLRERILYRSSYAGYDPAPVSERAKALTAYARSKWLDTKNMPWAYALARRTADRSDLPILLQAIQALGDAPPSPSEKISNLLLRRCLAAHATRILLMAGKTAEAAAFLREQTRQAARIASIQFEGWYGVDNTDAWANGYVLNGGIRLFIAHRDLDGARNWARVAAEIINESGSRSFPFEPQVQLQILMAKTPKELTAASLKEGHYSWGGPDLVLAIAELLPARSLLEMSAEAKLDPDVRRALFAAGWTRTYLLGRESEAFALLPRLRSLFPELSSDVDDIADASFAFSRDHALTHMLLRAPGFNPRPSWFRRSNNAPDIFAVMSGNPSDGNWWCSLDTALLKADMVAAFNRAMKQQPVQIAWFDSYFARPEKDRVRLVALAQELISWHPLFKAMDEKELAALSRIDSGPKMLSDRAVAWADASNVVTWLFGYDAALPETLHLAVRSTRYGCRRNGQHSAYSHAAFKYLHEHYPSSEWAKKTRYWFK